MITKEITYLWLIKKINIRKKIIYDYNLFLVQYEDWSLEWFMCIKDKWKIYNFLYKQIKEEIIKEKLLDEIDINKKIDIKWKRYEINWFNRNNREIYVFDNLKKDEDLENNFIVRNISFFTLDNIKEVNIFLKKWKIIDNLKEVNKLELMDNTILSLDITIPLFNKFENEEEKKEFLEYIEETNEQVITAINNLIPLIYNI